MNVYRESAPRLAARTFHFRRRGPIGPIAGVVVMILFIALLFGSRLRVTCSRTADRCFYDLSGALDSAHGSLPLSTIRGLAVEHHHDGTSHLEFWTTSGFVQIGSSTDNAWSKERDALATRFEHWLATHDERFDDGFGPSPLLVAVVLLTVAAACFWVARGGPWARVTVDPESDAVIVEKRDKPWLQVERRTVAHARIRDWRGQYEVYDDAGGVVPLPVGTHDPRARALAALLVRD